MERVARMASKVKTPLVLAAVVIWILYAIYKLFLSRDLFTNMGDDLTFLLLQKIIDNLFWLALAVTVLGTISYLIALAHANKPQPVANESVVDIRGDTSGDIIRTLGDKSPGKVGGDYTVIEREERARRGKNS